ncbi:CYFA0S07e02476g1_1 [Cyberlindnera fabianii]|uniref:CYFA0S07e02476g1_1 n=1 Tax=Cyberlindnera fabianii TaxID=36022 RepID=A0A061B397_CYBFA|nr:CYFA0S07e02476g1_1 [Cyberlindnera fabianii]
MLSHSFSRLISTMLLVATICYAASSDESSSSSSASRSSTTNDSPFPTMNMYSIKDGVWFVDIAVGSDLQQMELRVDISQPYLWLLNASAFPTCGIDSSSTSTSSITASAASASSESSSDSSSEPSSTSSSFNDCESHGSYNLSSSNSSIPQNNSYASYLFLDNVYVNGSVVNDDIIFLKTSQPSGNNTLKMSNLDFILANESNVEVGALGLGGNLDSDTSGYNFHFLDSLVDNGFINSSAYSVGSITNTSGKIVFGAVDTDMFVPPLVQFENIPYSYREDDIRYNYPIVPLSSILLRNDKGITVEVSNYDTPIPSLMDTRASYMYLPQATVVSLAVQVGAYYLPDSGVWFVKCAVEELDATLSFRFGNLTIDVSIARFISSLSTDSGDSVTFEDGSEACALRVLPDAFFGYSLIGMPVLQDTYMAFDVEGHNLAMAQANNDHYKSTLVKVDNYTSTTSSSASTNIPWESSEILSGTIPFAVPNNITDPLTFSYSYARLTDSAMEGMTAVYTSGVVFTGRVVNSTSRSDHSSTTSQTSSIKGDGGIGGNVLANDGMLLGVFASLSCLFLGLIL